MHASSPQTLVFNVTADRPSLPGAFRRALGLAAAIAALGLAAPSVHAQTACDADIDGDGVVGAADLARLLGAWGPCVGCAADVDDDGSVNAADLSALLGLWGVVCSPLSWATVLEFTPDPAVVTDPSLRASIIATGLPWRVRDNGTGIEMLLIPPGTFDMGCSPSKTFGCGADENPVHGVTLTNPFYLGRYEVTQAQWLLNTGTNPSFFTSPSAQVPSSQVTNRPVDRVSWDAVQAFNAQKGLRLPTEAEWEYACRAGTSTAFHSMPGFPNGTNDDGLLGNIAWFDPNSAEQTRPVGQKAANALGVHDMLGNVEEWVNDWYGSTYYASSPSTNPQGPAVGSSRVLRGGSFNYLSVSLRSSFRDLGLPVNTGFDRGFRVARNP